MEAFRQLHPAVRVFIIALTALLALALVAVGVFILLNRIYCHAFYKQAEVEFNIPGLADGMVPQGMEYFPEQDAWVSCGYMNGKKTASRFYITTDEHPDGLYVEMKRQDGSDYCEHTGGVSFFGDYVYVPGTAECVIFSLADLFDGDQTATIQKELLLPIDPAYCTVYDGKLYVGTYYNKGKHETPKEQHLVTPSGDQNYAIMIAYTLDAATGLVDTSVTPTVYSTPQRCQGAAWIDDHTLVLSTSWSLNESHLLIYDLSKASTGSYTLNNEALPLYYLDAACLTHDIVAPAMAEQIVVKDGRIFISNESASRKYIFGILLGAHKAYSYPVPSEEVTE